MSAPRAMPADATERAPAAPHPLHAVAAPLADPGPLAGVDRAPVNAAWRRAWAAALDKLELDLDAAERLLADLHRGGELPIADPWSPPAGLGPLPLDLTPRADTILARQLAVASAIAVGISLNRRQATVASRLESGRESTRPAYLDCAM